MYGIWRFPIKAWLANWGVYGRCLNWNLTSINWKTVEKSLWNPFHPSHWMNERPAMSHKNDTDHTRAGKISKTSTLNREISVFPPCSLALCLFPLVSYLGQHRLSHQDSDRYVRGAMFYGVSYQIMVSAVLCSILHVVKWTNGTYDWRKSVRFYWLCPWKIKRSNERHTQCFL